MNVVCKIEHIKKEPWSLLRKKSPQNSPLNFFFRFDIKKKLSCHIAVKFHDSHTHEEEKKTKTGNISSPLFGGELFFFSFFAALFTDHIVDV